MKAVITTAAVPLVGCSPSEPTEPVAAADIATILATPSAYDGALIRVSGAAFVRLEASFICPTPETLNSPGSSRKCLSLVPGESNATTHDIGQLDGRTVEVIGRFNAGSFGRMGAHGGAIAAIRGKVTGAHNMGEAQALPPPPGFRPTPLRDAAWFRR